MEHVAQFPSTENPRRLGRSIGAVLAGLLTILVTVVALVRSIGPPGLDSTPCW